MTVMSTSSSPLPGRRRPRNSQGQLLTGPSSALFGYLTIEFFLKLRGLPSVYLMSPVLTKSPRPSPSVFAYCKCSKTGGSSDLGTRLEVTAVGSVTVAVTDYGDVVPHWLGGCGWTPRGRSAIAR